jgi:hypothetical protein
MQKKRFWVVVLCSALLASEGFSAVFTSYLGPLRTAVLDEIEFVSSDVTTSNAFALRPLNQTRRALALRTRPSLTSDLQMLAAAATVLNRSQYADLFAPLVEDTLFTYASLLDTTVDSLGATLDTLPQSAQVLSAQRSLDSIISLRERADTSPNAEIAARLLSRAALQLNALQTTAARLARGNGSGNSSTALSAFINGDSFTADSITSAIFNPGVGALTITGTQRTGDATRTLTLSLTDIRSGTTTHILGGVGLGSYAIYSSRGTNILGYTSVSGSATVTVDTFNRTATGTFSFVGSGRSFFDPPVQVSGGTFSLPLR